MVSDKVGSVAWVWDAKGNQSDRLAELLIRDSVLRASRRWHRLLALLMHRALAFFGPLQIRS